ncbi:MAG TPA: signal peptidase I [Thermoanaerobaculia bacterium]|nr:signal peptidase I [Thermoanaerobaculia bacterium]
MKDAEAAYLEAEYGDVTEGDWPPKRRRPVRRSWVAVGLTLLLLGLGHVYVGEMRRGLVLWSGFLGLLMGSAWSGLLDRFWGLLIVLVAALGLLVYAMGDAASRARRLRSFDPKPYNRWWVYAAVVLFAAVVGPGIRALVPIQSFYIPSGSMEPTLQPGDHFYARRGTFGAEDLARGEIVVLRSPEDPTVFVVYRIVGLAGEEIDVVDKAVHIDGRPLDEPYAHFREEVTYPDSSSVHESLRRRDQFGPFLIPEETVFVMGDNRDRSYDSRFIGPVPLANLHARPLYIYWHRDPVWTSDFSRIGRTVE